MNVLKHEGTVPPAPSNTFVMSIPPSKKSGGTTVCPTPSVASEVSHLVLMLPLKGSVPELVVAQIESPPSRAFLQSPPLLIGSPSQPGGPYPGRSVQVSPGQTVQSLLRDYSTCQAPLSDNARVTVPGSTITAVRPADLRACTLRVSQLGKPS